MCIPYTYRITCVPTGRHYYGVRFAKNCKPDDLWTTYFTSSKPIKRLIEEFGKDSFSAEVRKVFNDVDSAREWEQKVLERLNVRKNDNWINTHCNNSIGGFPGESNPMYGKVHPNKGKKMPQTANHGPKNPMYGKRGEDHPAFGFKRTDEMNKATGDKLRGRPKSAEHKNNIKKSKNSKEYLDKVQKPIYVFDKRYDSVTQALKESTYSNWFINTRLRDPNNTDVRYADA